MARKYLSIISVFRSGFCSYPSRSKFGSMVIVIAARKISVRICWSLNKLGGKFAAIDTSTFYWLASIVGYIFSILIHLSTQIQYSIPKSLEIPYAVAYPFQDLNLIIGALDKPVGNLIFSDSSNFVTPFSESIYAVTEFWNVEFSD